MTGKLRLVVIVLISAFSLAGTISILPTVNAAAFDAATPPEGYVPEKVNYQSNSLTSTGTKVLIVLDVYPWSSLGIQTELNNLNVAYDQIGSATFPSINLVDYRLAIFPSDQPQGYYDTIAANMGKLESYVGNGGLLMANCADDGWAGGTWSSLIPGGVGHVREFSYNNYFEIPDHPYIGTIPWDDFQGWSGDTSFGYFEMLYTDTNIIMTDQNGYPTVIEYKYGEGWVFAMMQIIEYAYTSEGNTQPLANEVRYMTLSHAFTYTLPGEEIVTVIPSETTVGQQQAPPQQASPFKPSTGEYGDTLAVCLVLGAVSLVLMAIFYPRD